MGQPVKLSDTLIDEARATATATHRSIAGQIEHWAAIGRSLEPLLGYDELLRLKGHGGATSLSAALAAVATPTGDAKLRATLARGPFPHYEPVAGSRDELVRIDADGTRTRGRFVGREFVASR